MLGKWAIKERRYGSAFNAIMFRRTTVSADDAIERARQVYCPLGAKFIGSGTPRFRMPNGGRVSFAYLERVTDADEYQGRNVTDVWVEEAGQFPDPKPIDRLNGVLRSAEGIPTQLIVTANPGGAGQVWMRDRYQLHPFPKRPRIISRVLGNGSVHRIAVIPSRLSDNRILTDSDPNYVNRLHMVGSADLVRGWLEGDWSAIAGAFFDCWSESKHVLEPFPIPEHWMRFRSMDWGSARPFSVGWWAVVSDDFAVDGRVLPRGALVRYREWYGAKGPNEGLKIHAEQVADGIKQREAGEKIAYGTIDPAAFQEDGGPSIAERMMLRGVHWTRADNARVSGRGALGGWDQMRGRLKGDDDGRPMLYVFSTCRDFIRTVPAMQHDPNRPEDVDTNSEDHAADEARYGCMSRPWVPPTKAVREVQISDYRGMGSSRDDDADGWRIV